MTTLGIIGGTGELGSSMATAWLETLTVKPHNLWVSNRSGTLGPLMRWDSVRATPDAQAMVQECDIVVLSVPPAEAANLQIATGDRLVISVMAGVTLERLAEITRGTRIVRAMSSPAAAQRLAYSPWIARDISEDDANTVTKLLGACGLTDRVGTEDMIDRFTAITGPVPGFVAAFADAVVAHATRSGIPPEIATRAVRQLFLAAGTVMSLEDDKTPRDYVDGFIAYDGTTAAGLREIDSGPLKEAVHAGLEAAYAKAKTIAE